MAPILWLPKTSGWASLGTELIEMHSTTLKHTISALDLHSGQCHMTHERDAYALTVGCVAARLCQLTTDKQLGFS